jgi:hypothetical protein
MADAVLSNAHRGSDVWKDLFVSMCTVSLGPVKVLNSYYDK